MQVLKNIITKTILLCKCKFRKNLRKISIMTEFDLQNRLVQNLKKIRKSKNLTQEKLAEKAGLSSQIINDIEGGRRWPRRATLSKITSALEIDAQELFAADLISQEKMPFLKFSHKDRIEILSLCEKVISQWNEK